MSEFWTKKIRTLFKTFDYDKDGLITVGDFDVLAERYGDGANDERKTAVKATLRKLFDTFCHVAGAEDGKISEKQLIESVKKQRDDPQFVEALKDVAAICYGLLDSDGDGIIKESDYIRLFWNHNIPDHEKHAKVSFADLDADRDGKLNFEQTSAGFYNYFRSDDEKLPGSIFFGPPR